MNLIIFQRVLPQYRYELFRELAVSGYFSSVEVIASKGEKAGAQKSVDKFEFSEHLKISLVESLNFRYKGTKRSSFIPLYPFATLRLRDYDYILAEGTTNIFNNVFIILFAKLYRKKIIWWDAGYSESSRTLIRKLQDIIIRFFISQTYAQMAYSSNAKEYLITNLKAANCFQNLNTIATSYFIEKQENYRNLISSKVSSSEKIIKLLYVGAIEERKKLHILINTLRNSNISTNVELTIIGDGSYKESLEKLKINDKGLKLFIKDPIYRYEYLEKYYLDAHLFIMPGEGGLAIIQAIQFGLPVITVSADGTERDYISPGRNGYICCSINEIVETIQKFLNADSKEKSAFYHAVLDEANKVSSKAWIEKLVHFINDTNKLQ